MRALVSTVVLLAAAFVCYASWGASAQAQAQAQFVPAGLVEGEKVRLVVDVDRGSTYQCTVMEVRGEFLGCRNETQSIGQTAYTRWYNLRLIARIDRPERRD